jgi:hypothetical protein
MLERRVKEVKEVKEVGQVNWPLPSLTERRLHEVSLHSKALTFTHSL